MAHSLNTLSGLKARVILRVRNVKIYSHVVDPMVKSAHVQNSFILMEVKFYLKNQEIIELTRR